MKLGQLSSKNISSEHKTARAASTGASLRVRSNIKAGPNYNADYAG